MRLKLALIAVATLVTTAVAKDSREQVRGIAGEQVAAPQRLELVGIPKPTGKPVALFDG